MRLNAGRRTDDQPVLTNRRIEAETKQASLLNSFQFKFKGKPITANEIDDLLEHEHATWRERKAVWEASKEIGPTLQANLMRLRDLRNGVAGELNFPSYFRSRGRLLRDDGRRDGEDERAFHDASCVRSICSCTPGRNTSWRRNIISRCRTRSRRTGSIIVGRRTGPAWSKRPNLDPYFKGKTAEWIAKTAEDFLPGLGLQPLPASFWVKSDLYPVPPGNPRKKNTHASCWHIDLDNDIRSLQSIEPNSEWFFTAHHELGHGHYFLVLYPAGSAAAPAHRRANPGFHEGIGELIALASSQVPYLQAKGILPADFKADKTAFLLDDALARSVPFIFFASGTMTHWEGGHLRAPARARMNGTSAGGIT